MGPTLLVGPRKRRGLRFGTSRKLKFFQEVKEGSFPGVKEKVRCDVSRISSTRVTVSGFDVDLKGDLVKIFRKVTDTCPGPLDLDPLTKTSSLRRRLVP